MEITLQGNLRSFKLPDILTFLNLSRKTGTLHLTTDLRNVYIYYDDGNIVYAGSNQQKFRLSSVLLRKKIMEPAQWKKLEATMAEKGEKFGRLAVEEGILSEYELRDYLKIQVSEIIYDCFTWDTGKFSFVDVMQLPEYAVTISVDLANLIMEGARRIDEWERCLQLFPRRNMVFRVVGSPETQDKISLSLDEWRILFLIDGRRTLEEVCHAADEQPLQVYRVIYGLYANKLLESIEEDPTGILESPLYKEPGKSSDEEVHDQTTGNLLDDTSLLVSPDANLSYRDVLKVTLARLTMSDSEKKIFPLVEQEYYLGRQAGSQIFINDPSISNVHARIFRGPEGYVLEDLNSRNGTFVNGNRIDRKLLQENDRIRLGNSEMVYSIVYEVRRVPHG